MTIEKRLRALSGKTASLLTAGETERVDFKKIPGAISSEDLVAFANSNGGEFLVGVIEEQKNGVQCGRVVGCDVSDGAILQILNRASSCIPPIALRIRVENLRDRPILRVVIPESSTRPHCTPKGVYCRREGTRTRPLHPSELLSIFLDIEARSFAEKFESAAHRISEELGSLEEELDASIRRIGDQLGWADSQLGDTEDNVSAILGLVARIDDATKDTNDRIRALFQQDARDDPVKEAELKKLISQLAEEIYSKPKLRRAVLEGKEFTYTAQGKAAKELSMDELQKAMVDAGEIVRKKVDLKRYSREMKTPSECSTEEIDSFIGLVRRGGEVSDGIENRIARAKMLGFVKYDGHPVGVAAIKRPLKAYCTRVFQSAKSNLTSEDFSLELGWIYLKENHRQKGQITPLLESLMSRFSGMPMFATTRSSNLVMIELLKQFKFKKEGEAYPSSQYPDETLHLFVRPQ